MGNLWKSISIVFNPQGHDLRIGLMIFVLESPISRSTMGIQRAYGIMMNYVNLLGKITYRMETHTPSAMEIRESERSLSYGHVWILLDVAMFRFHVYWAKVVHPDAQ